MGVTLHKVIPEMDAGPILLQSEIYSAENKPRDLAMAAQSVSFREHYMVRRLGETWN